MYTRFYEYRKQIKYGDTSEYWMILMGYNNSQTDHNACVIKTGKRLQFTLGNKIKYVGNRMYMKTRNECN